MSEKPPVFDHFHTDDVVINQTLIIWSVVVIIEVFILAYLIAFPWLLFAGLIMIWPIRVALAWPRPRPQAPQSHEVPIEPSTTLQ